MLPGFVRGTMHDDVRVVHITGVGESLVDRTDIKAPLSLQLEPEQF
jgi:hypothetical protein